MRMPIYEYECAKCKKVHEIWQKITEDPVSKCPDCGKKMERLISASGFALKGSGWYKTDYERKAKPSKKSSDGESKKDSGDSAPESKSESKPDKSDNKAQAA